jgi:hypothetical protein
MQVQNTKTILGGTHVEEKFLPYLADLLLTTHKREVDAGTLLDTYSGCHSMLVDNFAILPTAVGCSQGKNLI